MIHMLIRAVATAAFLVAPASLAAQDRPLPTDPRLVSGELDNGLRYVVRRHDNPPGRASIWLHVSTGSLNETDSQRGIAHFLEHMAFNGSRNFPPGTVIDFFQSLGLTFGVHQNAFTSFDQTVYLLALPDARPETLDKAMLFLSDVAFRLDLPAEEIEKERQVILEERRARLGGLQRIFDYILERYAPGSRFGQRLPIGTEQTIRAVSREDFADYYRRWYVPSNMTVIAVADADPALVVERVKAHFAEGARAPRPQDADPGVAMYTSTRAIVAADPEVALAQVSIVRVSPVNPPVTTVDGLRRQAVRQLGTMAFNRRMQGKAAQSAVAFRNGGAAVSDTARALRLIEATASGEPGTWPAMLQDIARELRRAVLHGFSPREIEDVRRLVLSQAERAVEVEPTVPAQGLLAVMNESVGEGEPIMSAAQYLELMNELVPSITAQEVTDSFRRLFDAGPDMPVAFVLQVPTTADVPSEERLIELGRAALSVSPPSELDTDRPAALMDEPPAGGRLVELGLHQPSQVWSGWLSNGVRVHYRFMDYRKDTVGVTIALAGGEIQETADTRGISEAAALAWARPATGSLTSTNIRDIMTGSKVTVAGRPGVDTMALSVSGSPAELEKGLQLAHLLLTDPVIEQAIFDQWQEQQRQLVDLRARQIEFVFLDLVTDSLYPPDEPRTRALTAGQLGRLTREAAQDWLRALVRTAPIEVTVVGDIERDRALELLTTYLGSLPARERISSSTLDDLRAIARPAGPMVARGTAPTQTDKAMALSGFFGAEYESVRDARLLNAAARILSTRMIKTIREERQLVYSISATSSAAVEFPGYGTFTAYSSTAPAKVDALLAAIDAMYAAFAESGPTPEEMDTLRRQMANTLDERMREPSHWSRAISTMTYRGASLDDVVREPDDYQAMTAAEIREAFARYRRPATSFQFAVTPEGADR